MKVKSSRHARHNLRAEIVLILTFGLALVMIILFWLVNTPFLPLAFRIDVPPILEWIGLSAFVAVTFGLLHGWLARMRVGQARHPEFLIRHFDEALRRASTEQRQQEQRDDQRQHI